MNNNEMMDFSSENSYLAMQTSFLSILLKMPMLLTAPNYLQDNSNSNSKPPRSLLWQTLNTLQALNQTHKQQMSWCETKERLLLLIKYWGGCFWREPTLPLAPNQP